MVCTIRGKHSHFCIGWAQSMYCAMMRHMTAVGHRHVCPTLTNTHLVNPPIKQNFGNPVSPVTKRGCFLANGTNKWGRMSLIISVGSLLLSVQLFQVRHHSLTLQCRAKLYFDHETVAYWSQIYCKRMSNLILICSLQIFLMVFGGGWGWGWQYCGNIE